VFEKLIQRQLVAAAGAVLLTGLSCAMFASADVARIRATARASSNSERAISPHYWCWPPAARIAASGQPELWR